MPLHAKDSNFRTSVVQSIYATPLNQCTHQSTLTGAKMPLKRRPPKGNVRRVQYVDGNLRYTLTNKRGRIVQAESTQELKLTLVLDFDPTVSDYASQPETFEWLDQNGKHRRYTPDYIVWRVDGSVEIHEVTISERRQTQKKIKEREEVAAKLCADRGWEYIVHTETTLPNATEFANLQALQMFAPSSYANDDCIHVVKKHFEQPNRIRVQELVKTSMNDTGFSASLLRATIAHMLWHGMLTTDMHQLIFDEVEYLPNVVVWMEASNQ